MTDVDGIKLGLEMYQNGKEDAIKQVLEIVDERISLLDREHEGDCLAVVRSVLRDLRDEFEGLRGEP